MTDPTKRFVFWGVMVLLVIAPLIGLEVFLRVVGLGNPVLYYRNTSFRYAPVPNQRVTRRRGATVTIDSYGLRGVRDWAEPADVKLLFIGNSVTWSGTYIDDRQTFPHLTCVHLRAQLGRDFTCGNAGVNAYGTDNMAERLRYKRFNDEDVIVVTIVPGDATRGLADVRSFYFFSAPPPTPFKAIWEVSTFLLVRVTHWMRHHGGQNRADDQIEVATRSLERLFVVLREETTEGKKVLLVLSPYEAELHAQEDELTQHVRMVLASSGLPLLDLRPRMSDSTITDAYVDGVHLEVQGHAAYAEAIAAEVSRILASDPDRVAHRSRLTPFPRSPPPFSRGGMGTTWGRYHREPAWEQGGTARNHPRNHLSGNHPGTTLGTTLYVTVNPPRRQAGCWTQKGRLDRLSVVGIGRDPLPETRPACINGAACPGFGARYAGSFTCGSVEAAIGRRVAAAGARVGGAHSRSC